MLVLSEVLLANAQCQPPAGQDADLDALGQGFPDWSNNNMQAEDTS